MSDNGENTIRQVPETDLWLEEPPRWSFRGPIANRRLVATAAIYRGDDDEAVGEIVANANGSIHHIRLDGVTHRTEQTWPDDANELGILEAMAEELFQVDIKPLQAGVEAHVYRENCRILPDHARIRRLSAADLGVWLSAAAAAPADVDAGDLLDALIARATAVHDPAARAVLQDAVVAHADAPWAMRALAALGAAEAA